jgi:hypothetical protein
MPAVRLVNGQEYVRLRDLFRSLLPDSLPEGWGAAEMPGLIERQEAARRLIEGEFLAGRVCLFVIPSDKDVMPLPDEARRAGEADGACFDSIDWENTIAQGFIYLRGLTIPANLQHMMRPGDRPLLWVLAADAAALKTESERPEDLRGLSPQQRGGAAAGARRKAKADRWRKPAEMRALDLMSPKANPLSDRDLIGRVYRHLGDHVFKDNPEDCPNYRTVENYLKSWMKDQRKAASQKPPES